MRGIRPTLTLPIAALAASMLASGSAIAQSAAGFGLQKVDVCTENGLCNRSRALAEVWDVTFDSNDRTGNRISVSRQCAGLKYPEQPWPDHCSVTLEGPEIDKRFGNWMRVEFIGPDRFTAVDRDRQPTATLVTTASILPGRGCVDGGKCVATFQGYGDRIFDYNNKSGDTFSYVYKCEVGVDFPAKPWPAGCSIMPKASNKQGYRHRREHKTIEACSPFCLVEQH